MLVKVITDSRTTYTCEVAFEGGSGKASIVSPATIEVKGGKAAATVEWSSENYDYMLVDGDKYLRTNDEGNSVFTIPVTVFDAPMAVVGDTTAMSTPHEIDYTLTFDSATLAPAAPASSGSVPVVPIVAVIVVAIIVGVVIGVMRSKRDERA